MEHKQEIKDTRSIGFGSSDAKMIASVGKTGVLNETAKKRIAEMLGLKERQDVNTYSMRLGNEIEDAIFKAIKSKAENALSNPFSESKSLTDTFGFKVFNHIDIEIQNEQKIIWYEIKATIKSADETFEDYRYQMAWHWMILIEKGVELSKVPTLLFTHYDTSTGETNFNADLITQKSIGYDDLKPLIDEIIQGLSVISVEIPKFQYIPHVTSDGSNLPEETNKILRQVNHLLRMVKEAEEQVDKFKAKLKETMEEYEIKSIDNDFFKVTYVPEGVTSRFDSKSFQTSNPELYAQFLKNSNVKSSLRITLK